MLDNVINFPAPEGPPPTPVTSTGVENLNIMNDKIASQTEGVVIDPETGESTGEIVNTPHKIDESNPMASEKELDQLLKQMRNIMGMLEAQWESSKKEFNLKDDHMKLLYQFNEQNHDPIPKELLTKDGSEPRTNEALQMVDEQGKVLYDPFNGLRKLTQEDVNEIFGEDHSIQSPLSHDVTLDRIESVMRDFFGWMTAVKEYRQIHDGYMQLIEHQEDQEIQKMIKTIEETDDEDMKTKLQSAVDLYYNRKYLDFLAEPLDEKEIERIIGTWSNAQKVEYWLKRSRDKLKQLKISDKFILEISKFEERFLMQHYHHQNNILLTYFAGICQQVDPYIKNDPNRGKVVCMVFALDRFIRNCLDDNIRERILCNILALEDQFMGKLPNAPDDIKDVLVEQ